MRKNNVWTIATEKNEHCGHQHRTRARALVCLRRFGGERRGFFLYEGNPEDQDDPKWMGPKVRVRGTVE